MKITIPAAEAAAAAEKSPSTTPLAYTNTMGKRLTVVSNMLSEGHRIYAYVVLGDNTMKRSLNNENAKKQPLFGNI